MFILENPQGVIYCLALIVLAIVLKIIGMKRIFTKTYSTVHPLLDYLELRPYKVSRNIIIEALVLSAIIMLMIAYMNPYYTYMEKIRVEKKGYGELILHAKPATVLIIDVSGSMHGEKLETAKKALIEFINEINGTLDIGLIAFNGKVEVGIPPTSNYDLLIKVIKSLNATDGTMYSYPLSLALNWLKIYREFNITVSIVFASDGLPADADQAMEIVDQYAKDNITIYGIFIGYTDEGYRMIKQMSDKTHGLAYKADEISELVSIYKRIASYIKNATLSNVEVKMYYEKTITRKISLFKYFALTSLVLILATYYYVYRTYRLLY